MPAKKPRPDLLSVAQKDKIVVPPWVPDAVKTWALDEIATARDEKKKEALRRLLTDKRMRRVWRELTRHKRQNHRTTNKPFHQRDWPTTLCEKKGAKCLAVNVGKGIWRCRPCGLIT